MTRPFTLTPIGRLRTPFADRAACPRNGRQPEPPPLCFAEVFAEFLPGLRAIEGFSHLILLYWLDEAPPVALQFTPPFDATPRGVFATRAPCRPNPIALSVVAFEGLAGPGRVATLSARAERRTAEAAAPSAAAIAKRAETPERESTAGDSRTRRVKRAMTSTRCSGSSAPGTAPSQPTTASWRIRPSSSSRVSG